MEIVKAIQHALGSLKNKSTVEVAGQNKNLNKFKKVWIGSPEWQTYNVHYPNGETKKETYKTLNLPRYITRAWANNYANENATLTIPQEKSNNRLQEILGSNNFFGKWNNFVESMMGLGIGAIVENIPNWEYDEDSGQLKKSDSDVKIQFVRGERVYPITIDDGEVTECAFITYRTGGCKLVIHWINENGYYSITEVKSTGAGTDGSYNFDFKGMTTINTLSPIPFFQCWSPNITQDDEVEVGTAVFSKAYDAFMQCDVDYTSLFKEIKLGGKVKYISMEKLSTDTSGNMEIPYDINDESVVVLEHLQTDKPDMKTFVDELRVQQLIQSINFNMNLAAMLCGLGSNQFEFDGAGGRPIQTATGVIAKQTELYRNVIKQENYAAVKLKDMIKAIAFLNDNYTTNPQIGSFKDSDVQITFDDNIMEDTDSKKKNDQLEVQQGIMSLAEYRAEWYGEDLDSAKVFLQENAMLITKYQDAVLAGVMLPETFIDIVYGENYKFKNELIDYIKEKTTASPVMDFGDETDDEEAMSGGAS